MKLIFVFTRIFIFINFTFVELEILMPLWNIISASKGDYPSIMCLKSWYWSIFLSWKIRKQIQLDVLEIYALLGIESNNEIVQ